MKKILLLIIFGCLVTVAATKAQTSASVLSPSSPTLKFSMSDSDQSNDQATQTQAATPSKNSTPTLMPAKDSKEKIDMKDDDHDHFTCTKEGCTHHHKKDQPCCKKEEKKEVKPTFMQDPNAPK
jgi:ABC-type nickel/cobalt efflux system permease component RcnA